MLGYPHLWKPTRHWEAPLLRKCASLYRRSAQVLQVRWRFRMAKAMPCHAAMVKLYMEDGVRSSLHSWDVRNIDGLVTHVSTLAHVDPEKISFTSHFGRKMHLPINCWRISPRKGSYNPAINAW